MELQALETTSLFPAGGIVDQKKRKQHQSLETAAVRIGLKLTEATKIFYL